MKVKALLYTTRQSPYLYRKDDDSFELSNKMIYEGFDPCYVKYYGSNNGKIVAECDYEIEEIMYNHLGNPFYDFYGMQLHTKTLKESEILQHSKLKSNELRKYLLRNEDDYISPLAVGRAIYIKNLHIFSKPKELSEYYTNRIYTKIENVYTDEIQSNGSEWIRPIKKAPQNMMYAYDTKGNKYVVISIQPQWLCKILNGEKTIEVRKKVLKEMLKNEKGK